MAWSSMDRSPYPIPYRSKDKFKDEFGDCHARVRRPTMTRQLIGQESGFLSCMMPD